VAYVERVVSSDEIIVSQDSWGGDFSWARITRASKGWPSGFIHFNDVPLTNEARPTVEGTARVGSVLSASPGSWEPGGVTVAYQWRADGEDIAGADDPTLKLTQALEGARIRVSVTASKLGYPTTSALSTATAAVQPGVLRNTVAPGITGLPRVDETLTVTAGTWTPSPGSVTYRWLADGTPIPGASGDSLAVTPELVGASISVAATAVKAGYDPVTATSAATAPVAPGTLTAPTSLVVEGAARPGEVLTVTVPEVTPAATPSITWLRQGKPVAGATGRRYEVTPDDLGARLEAQVEWTRPGYTPATAQSEPTPVVRTTPVLRIGVDPVRRTLSVRAAVRSPDLDPVEGVVRIRARGELLDEVRLTDGYATTKLRKLPVGTWTFRFRFPTTREAVGTTITRRITIG
jgi:hypothetical protein